MKKKLYFIAMLLIGVMGVSNAQEENPECRQNLSIYNEHVKVKNYDAAYAPWKMVYENCPSLSWANFLYGERILKDKIKNSSGTEKDGFIQDLIAVYEGGLKYFPKKTSIAEVACDIENLKYDNKMSTNQSTYDALHKAFTEDHENFSNPKSLYLYFRSLVNLHEKGSKELQLVFDAYDDVTAKIEAENKKLTNVVTQLLPKEDDATITTKEKNQLRVASRNSETYGKIQGSIDAKLGQLANCENLVPLYEKNFESKKGDLKWVKRAVSRMFNKECTDDPLFKKMFEVQMAMDPSANAYMFGGKLKMDAGDTKGAIADYNKAVELEEDKYRKSDILYKIATTYRRGSKSTSRNYAQKAVNANPANGKAYLLIASLYANSANQCGTTTFEKRAIYWKAAEMARKAGRVDPSLKSRSNRAAESYNAKAPTKTQIFNNTMEGKTVSFSKCWVGGSVKVPKL